MQDNKYREASKSCWILLETFFIIKNCNLIFILVGFYDPIVKKHEDNVRDILCEMLDELF